MAKTKKVATDITEEQPEIQEPDSLNVEQFKEENKEETLPEETVSEQPIYVPDIPAQMEEKIPDNVTKTVAVEISVEVTSKADTPEILFLRKILQIQEEGCFGRHLNQLIYDRIKELQK